MMGDDDSLRYSLDKKMDVKIISVGNDLYDGLEDKREKFHVEVDMPS